MSRIIDNFDLTDMSKKRNGLPEIASQKKKGTGLSLVGLLFDIRKLNLQEFCQKHETLFQQAIQTQDFAPVTQHYYALMAPLIEKAYGTSLHFTPPDYAGQSLEEAIFSMHLKIGKFLDQLSPTTNKIAETQKTFLDLGCSVGGIMRDIAVATQHKVQGVTLGHNEVAMNNRLNEEMGLAHLCHAFQGDFNSLQLEKQDYHACYAIYALKYFVDLSPIFASVSKVLQKQGIFLIYDIIKTKKYDSKNAEHVELVSDFEYACGMPPLHTEEEMLEIAKAHGFSLVESMDLTLHGKKKGNLPWFYFFDRGLLKFLVNSPIIQKLCSWSEVLGILPRGYTKFNSIFIQGTVQKIVQAGRMGILSGSQVLVFRKNAGGD